MKSRDNIGYQDDCSYCKEYSYEKYRADFVLARNNSRLIIEIDGKEFHKDFGREEDRDRFLNNEDYFIIHIPANELNILKTKIKEFFNLKED